MPVNLEDFESWINTSPATGAPAVTAEDAGKTATIVDLDMVDTKFGRRMRVLLKFADGAEKVIFLSKSKARTLAKYFEQRDPSLKNPELWRGKQVKIERVSVLVRGEMRQTLTLLPA